MQPIKNDGYENHNNLENVYDIMSSEKARTQNFMEIIVTTINFF